MPRRARPTRALRYSGLGYGGGPDFAFFGCLQLGGYCPATSPSLPGVAMRYRFLYDNGSGPLPITGARSARSKPGPGWSTGPRTSPGRRHRPGADVPDGDHRRRPPPDPDPAGPGCALGRPAAHVIVPDPSGGSPSTRTPSAAASRPSSASTARRRPRRQPAPGSAGRDRGASGSQRPAPTCRSPSRPPGWRSPRSTSRTRWPRSTSTTGTRSTSCGSPSSAPACCTPIDATLSVQFTVDHEEMDSGAWSLAITSCSPSAPGDITPTISSWA